MEYKLYVKEFLVFLFSFLLTLLVLPRLSNIASKIGLVDHPEKRKSHKDPKPLVGGIGMIIGFAISCLLFIPLKHLRGFYSGVILLVIIGFLDDFKELDHRWKFVAQIIATVLMISFSDTVLHTFGNLLSFGPINLNRFDMLITIFGTIGVVNAINMIDGLDGLAGGVSFVAFFSFACLAFVISNTQLMLLSLAFSGAILSFLRYNWHPSKLFMGDAGSLSIGFGLTFIAIALTQSKNSAVPPVVPLLVLAVPIVDTLTVMIRRILQGKNAFQADKSHLHHILLRFGFSSRATVMIIVLLTALFSLFGIYGVVLNIPDYYLFMVFSAYFILYFMSSFHIKRLYRYKLKHEKKDWVKEDVSV